MSEPLLTLHALRTTAVEVPMRRPLGTSVALMRSAPLLLLDLETEESVTGRAYLFCYRTSALPALTSLLADTFELVRGRRVEPAELAATLGRAFTLIGVDGLVRMALSALDAACWDALAVAAGVPLCAYLGAEPRAIPAYNSNGLSLTSPDAAAVEARELAGEGFGAVKLRLGHPSLQSDLAAARAVRAALPAEVQVMADFNQALTPAAAGERLHALDGEGLAWFEEPIRHDDYAGCASLARELATPIQLGENFNGAAAMRTALVAGACDLAMPDLARIGGVTGWLEAARIAADAGLPLSSHLFPEVSVHLLAASPTAHWLEYVDWAAPILAEPLTIRDGAATPPARPGAGLAWDDEAVARYSI